MLTRVAVLLSIVLAFTRGATAGPACISEAKANAAQDGATKVNEARFAKALTVRKLKPIALQRLTLGPLDIYAPARFESDQVTTTTSSGATVRAITRLEGSCGGPGPEFAQQGNKVFRIERKPTPGKATTIIVCGCPSPHFACGGARVVVQPVGYALPTGTTFGGVLDVAFAADSVAIAPDHPCPPVAPPP